MCRLQLTGCMDDSDQAGICGMAENRTAIERSMQLRVVCPRIIARQCVVVLGRDLEVGSRLVFL